MSLPKGAAKEGVFYELDYPPYVVRITETSGGKLQLIASGEEHDQGIPADEYDDFYARYAMPRTNTGNRWGPGGSGTRASQISLGKFWTSSVASVPAILMTAFELVCGLEALCHPRTIEDTFKCTPQDG